MYASGNERSGFIISFQFKSFFKSFIVIGFSFLGSPLIFDPNGLGLDYFNIWQFGVKDAATYANAFVKFQKDSSKMMKNATFGLHEAIAGSSKGVTHYFAARASNLPEFLKIRENNLAINIIKLQYR